MTKLAASIVATIIPTAALATDGSSTAPMEIRTVPHSLRTLSQELGVLRANLVAIENEVGTKGFVEKKRSAAQFVQHGDRLFQNRRYPEAIYYYQRYLALEPTLRRKTMLMAMKNLGYSKEALGHRRAALHWYTMALKHSLSSPQLSNEHRVTLLRKIYGLLRAHKGRDLKIVRRLLVSMLNLATSSTAPHELVFWASRLAFGLGEIELARRWLAMVEDEAADDTVDARSLYYRALIAVSRSRLETAKKLLKKAAAGPGVSEQTAHLIHLGLARVYIAQKKFGHAAKSFANIPKSSRYYDDTLIERVYMEFRRGNFRVASTLASLEAGKHEDPRFQRLVPYLALMSGEHERAKKILEDSEAEAREMSEWLRERRISSRPFTPDELVALQKRVGYLAPASPLVSQVMAIHSQSREIEESIREMLQDLNAVYIAIGAAELAAMQPVWKNRTAQMQSLLTRLFDAGHVLSAVESVTFDKHLMPAELRKLQNLEARRAQLLSQKQQMQNQHADWQENVRIWKTHQKVLDAQRKIELVRARIFALQWYGQQNEEASSKRLIAQSQAIEAVQGRLARVHHQIQSDRLQTFKNVLPLSHLQKLSTDYSMALMEAKDIFDRYRQSAGKIGLHLVSVEALKVWNDWQFVMERSFAVMGRIENHISTRVASLTNHMTKQVSVLNDLTTRNTSSRGRLGALVAKSKDTIIGHYLYHVEDRLSRIRKWKADLAWQVAEGVGLRQTDAKRRFEADKQELEQIAKSMQRGVHWDVPN